MHCDASSCEPLSGCSRRTGPGTSVRPVAADRFLVQTVRERLRAAADAGRAPQMQAYMKSAMPYLGVPVPRVRAIVRTEAKSRPPASTEQLVQTASMLWREARFREERYAATALTGMPAARHLQNLTLLPLYREMITTGAWWDHVDEVSHRVGALLAAYPDDVAPVIVEWAHDEDRWLRRCSVICQLGRRQATDTRLLSEAIEANLDDRDFFLRKADRLGTARLRENRSGLGTRIRRRARRSAQPAVTAGGAQASELIRCATARRTAARPGPRPHRGQPLPPRRSGCGRAPAAQRECHRLAPRTQPLGVGEDVEEPDGLEQFAAAVRAPPRADRRR